VPFIVVVLNRLCIENSDVIDVVLAFPWPQAVRSAVNTMLPDATVYEVRHCAYAILKYKAVGTAGGGGADLKEHDDEQASLLGAARDGGRRREAGRDGTGSWELGCKSGETGISWFA
jgi:hypothetical protein